MNNEQKKTGGKVSDHFEEIEDFEQLLVDAEESAGAAWAEDFVFDIREKFGKHGKDMFLSDTQLSKLEEIAEGDQA